MKRRAFITGTGVVTALGNQPRDLHKALCRGERASIPVRDFGGRELAEPAIAAPIASFTPNDYLGDRNLRPLDRAGRLAASAARLALDSGGLTEEWREREEVDLVVGTTFGSAHTIVQFDHDTLVSGLKHAKPLDFANTVINAAAGQTAIWHNLRGANTTVAAGKVSGLRALKHARLGIDRGLSNAVLAGGVEELSFETVFAFLQSGQSETSLHPGAGVPFHRDRNGFIPGEGAGFVVIEPLESARDRGATLLGELRGHGSSYDISRGLDEENAVTRCAEAIFHALDDADIEAGAVDGIICSANGSAGEDRIEALALERAFADRLASIPVTSIGHGLGETLGASGVLQAITFLEVARTGRFPGMTGFRDRYDENLPLLRIPEDPVEGEFGIGLMLSLGLDGNSAACVISAM